MIKISPTRISTWNRCRYRYKLQYVDGYTTPATAGQVRGSAGHAALASWYSKDYFHRDKEKALKACWDEIELEASSHMDKQSLYEEIEEALDRYFKYSEDYDHDLTFKLTETRFDTKIDDISYTGVIDGVIEQGNALWIMEHKFLKRASIGHVDLDPQISLYMVVARHLGYGVVGTLYNVIRMGSGPTAVKDPVLRTQSYRGGNSWNVLKYEFANISKDIQAFHEGGRVYRNPTRDCSWDCGFYNVCLAIQEGVNPAEVLQKYDKRAPEVVEAIVEEE